MTTGTSTAEAKEAKRRSNNLLEVLAVALLGVATIGSAWCGYQATRWNGREGDLAREAAVTQTEVARLFGLATQTVSYDANIISQYAQAFSDGNEPLMNFYRQTLVRPAFLPVLDKWEAQIAAGETPTNLLEDTEYIDEYLEPYRAESQRVESISVRGEEAGSHADAYVLTTLLLASALFFAGLTTSFRVRFARLLLLAAASLMVAYSASRLSELPIL
jgi:hypothetical protein